MVGQRHESAIELAILAHQNSVDHRFEVVVDQALRYTAKEGEGPVVGIKHHLLGLAWVGRNKHLAAVGQTKMRHLDGLVDTINFDMFLAPVELAGVTRGKYQRDKSLLNTRFYVARLPLFDEALHAVVGPLIPFALQTFE